MLVLHYHAIHYLTVYSIVGAGYDIITVQLSSFIIFVNLIEVVPLVDHLNLCTR